MELVCVALAAFSLLSVGRSAPLNDCESLTRPIQVQSRDELLGKWTYIGETWDSPGNKMLNTLTKMLVETVWWNITIDEGSDQLRALQNQKLLGLCFALKTNMTFIDSTLSMVQPFSAAAVFLSTQCPDCLVFYANTTIGSSVYQGIQLLSRRSAVSPAELEEFKKQAECLNLLPPVILDVEKGLCPDPSLSQETAIVDLTGSVSSDEMSLLDKLLKSENGAQMFMKLITNAISYFA